MNFSKIDLQNRINKLIHTEEVLGLDEYNILLHHITNAKEFSATVFVYDHMLANNIKPNESTFQHIDKLHSKTLPENNTIQLPPKKRSLNPRRRIHKIIKGHNYTKKYRDALQYADIVKDYLSKNTSVAQLQNRITLAKKISKDCSININEARYIITHLKRTNFFESFNNQSKMTDFFTSIK
tara:strand:- start:786 stop:1331 length:546 start_codon:yes stop_codon:yes gene_type:complete